MLARSIDLIKQWSGVLALFIVLSGGAAYAANTVFSSDIVDNQVLSADVRDDTLTAGGLTAVDLRSGSVGTAEVAQGAIRSGDVRDDTLAGGGLTSADLAEDSVGGNEFRYGILQSHARTWVGSTATNTDTPKELAVSCPLAANGEEVTGGGYVIDNGGNNVPTVVVQRNYAVDEHTWLVRAVATSGTPAWRLTVIANCLQ